MFLTLPTSLAALVIASCHVVKTLVLMTLAITNSFVIAIYLVVTTLVVLAVPFGVATGLAPMTNFGVVKNFGNSLGSAIRG